MDRVFSELDQRLFPYVVIGSRRPGSTCIHVDNEQGVHQAIDHLVSMGHRKIGHLRGIPDHFDGIQRYESFLSGMKKHGLEVRPEWVANGYFSPFEGLEAAVKVLDRPDRPTAVFCANDEMP